MKKSLFLFIFLLSIQLQAQDILIPYGSLWKYHDKGTNLGSTWTPITYDDAAWKSGKAKLGYGITDAATTISYGSDSKNKYITTYFRKQLTISDAGNYASYSFSVKRDDGVRVFVNGTEVFRNNLPTTTISNSTLASGSSGSGTAYTFKLNNTAFKTGLNVIAVEVHQESKTSADLAFDLKLTGTPLALSRGPYLQMGNMTGVTIRWRTNAPTNSFVEVGTSYGTYTASASKTTLTTEHEVRINNLLPETRYFYRVGSTTKILQGTYNNHFYTAPTPDSKDKVQIAVFGDCGLDKNGSQAATLNSYLNHVGSNQAELLLLLGDNAYDNGTDTEYQNTFFKPYGGTILKNHIIFPTPGNHDYGDQASRTNPYYKNFTMPTAGECGGVPSNSEAFYSYDWGNIHFISLDSYGTESPGSTRLYDTLGTQVKWLKTDLEANKSKWVIAYWHHPPYSMGTHNSDTEDQMFKIRQNFIRILERGGVDLILCGHSHSYERSYLLNNYYGWEKSFNKAVHAKSSSSAKYNGTTDSCPYVTETNAKNHGTLYVVSGSAGAADGAVAANWPHNAMPYSFNKGGMLYLEIKDNRLDGKFLRQDGVVADQFTLMQNVNKATTRTVAAREAVKLKASWIGNYQWSTGETTREITVYPTQDANYQVSDGLNCLTDVFNIKVTLLTQANQKSAATDKEEADADALPFIIPSQVKRGENISVRLTTNEEAEISITDSHGNQVHFSKFSGATSINSKKLKAGIYLAKTWTKTKVQTQKFVITN